MTIDSGSFDGMRSGCRGLVLGAFTPDPAEASYRSNETPSLDEVFLDVGYQSKIGDSVVVATRSGNRRGITSIPCYTSELRALQGNSKVADGVAECVWLASGTRAKVLKHASTNAQIKVISGPFAGQIFWAPVYALARPEVFSKSRTEMGRSIEEPKTAVAKSSVRKKRSTPRGDGRLVLTDLVATPLGGSLHVVGRFRNASNQDIKDVNVAIYGEDGNGRLVRAGITSFVRPDPLIPGEIGSFESLLEADDRYASIKLGLSTHGAAISWTDESGKNAHP